MTTTVEAFVPCNGRSVQAATSHHLGINFSKMFHIEFEDAHGAKRPVHQTSWAISTRSIGVMVMVHGDDKGIVLPPKVAQIQVVILPITYNEEEAEAHSKKCDEIKGLLAARGIRCHVDDRRNYTPGWKFNHWEVKGVCIRMELGPRDMKLETVRLVRRDTGERSDVPWSQLTTAIPKLLEDIHLSMFTKAKKKYDESIIKVTRWDEVMPALNDKKVFMAPWCEDPCCEDKIKQATQGAGAAEVLSPDEEAPALTGAAKTLCRPLDQPALPQGTKCFFDGKPAKSWFLFGRSY